MNAHANQQNGETKPLLTPLIRLLINILIIAGVGLILKPIIMLILFIWYKIRNRFGFAGVHPAFESPNFFIFWLVMYGTVAFLGAALIGTAIFLRKKAKQLEGTKSLLTPRTQELFTVLIIGGVASILSPIASFAFYLRYDREYLDEHEHFFTSRSSICCVLLGVVSIGIGIFLRASAKSRMKCPFCGGKIHLEVKKCRYCSSDLPNQYSDNPQRNVKLSSPVKDMPVSVAAKEITAEYQAKGTAIAPTFVKLENGSIHFDCGFCKQAMEIAAEAGGEQIKCPECGTDQKVPTS